MQYLNELIASIKSTLRVGSEIFYSLSSLLGILEKSTSTCFKVDESILLTPFYMTSKHYELYMYDLNIIVVDDIIYENAIKSQSERLKQADPDLASIWAQSTIILKTSNPCVPKSFLETYIRFLFNDDALSSEVERVFGNQFDAANMFFAKY